MIRRLIILLLIVGCLCGQTDTTKTKEDNYKYFLETFGSTYFKIVDYEIINDEIKITKDGSHWEVYPITQIKQVTDLNGESIWENKEIIEKINNRKDKKEYHNPFNKIFKRKVIINSDSIDYETKNEYQREKITLNKKYSKSVFLSKGNSYLNMYSLFGAWGYDFIEFLNSKPENFVVDFLLLDKPQQPTNPKDLFQQFYEVEYLQNIHIKQININKLNIQLGASTIYSKFNLYNYNSEIYFPKFNCNISYGRYIVMGYHISSGILIFRENFVTLLNSYLSDYLIEENITLDDLIEQESDEDEMFKLLDRYNKMTKNPIIFQHKIYLGIKSNTKFEFKLEFGDLIPLLSSMNEDEMFKLLDYKYYGNVFSLGLGYNF